jgi:hypothetical protein
VPVTKSLIEIRRTCTVPHIDDCTVALLGICECCFVVTVLETCTKNTRSLSSCSNTLGTVGALS